MKNLRRIGQGALILALLVVSGCSQPPPSSSIMLGGDVMLYRGGDPLFFDPLTAYSPWGDFLMAKQGLPVDLFAVNLESPFGAIDPDVNPDTIGMNLCADAASVAVLEQAGVGLATNANNHSNDCGADYSGYKLEVLQQVGIQSHAENSKPLALRTGNQKLVVISVNDYEGDYDGNEIMAQIKNARRVSDLVLVSIHWGLEYQAGPTRHQEELAQQLVNAGADVIWGHHPHLLQRIEWLPSEVDGHQAVVMYSLGNLLSDQWMLPDALRTAVIRMEFTRHNVKKILIIPLQMDMSTRKLLMVRNPEQLNWIKERLGLQELKKNGARVELYELAEGD